MIVIFFPFVGHQLRLWVFTIPYLCLSYSSHYGSFFISLVMEICFSASIQVIFIVSCSVSSCNFGVSIGEGEFRVFLCYHLGHLSLKRQILKFHSQGLPWWHSG